MTHPFQEIILDTFIHLFFEKIRNVINTKKIKNIINIFQIAKRESECRKSHELT